MNLLMFNLKLDVNDPPLSFTNDWVNEFAKHVDHLYLITMEKGVYEVPDNVQVFTVGLGKGVPKWKKTANFYRHLFGILRKNKIDGCFSHMQPIFSILAGPILNILNIPLVTWYAHPKINLTLKLAHFFSNHTVASLYSAYPYKKNKLTVIGQGIDTQLFQKIPMERPAKTTHLLYSGRISSIKNIETLVKAVALLKKHPQHDLLVTLTGNAQSEADERYLQELHVLIASLGLTHTIRFEKAISRSQLPRLNATADLYINLTPSGSGDKVVWEAMACETPTLVANTGFSETLGKYSTLLTFEYGNPVDLSHKIAQFLELSPIERADMGSYLRQQVIQMHSLNALPEKVLRLIKKQQG